MLKTVVEMTWWRKWESKERSIAQRIHRQVANLDFFLSFFLAIREDTPKTTTFFESGGKYPPK